MRLLLWDSRRRKDARRVRSFRGSRPAGGSSGGCFVAGDFQQGLGQYRIFAKALGALHEPKIELVFLFGEVGEQLGWKPSGSSTR